MWIVLFISSGEFLYGSVFSGRTVQGKDQDPLGGQKRRPTKDRVSVPFTDKRVVSPVKGRSHLRGRPGKLSPQGLTLRYMQEKPLVLFDGVCNFCNRMVNFAIRHDPGAKLRFTPLQSFTGKKIIEQLGVPASADTLVLIERGRAYTYASAAIRICKYLRWPAKMMYAFIIVPSFISQPIYRWIARNRYKWFGKKETCMVPTPEVKERFLS